MPWVYFTKPLATDWPAGWYEVSSEPIYCDNGEVVIYRGSNSNDLLKVKDKWGLCNWCNLPVKIAIPLDKLKLWLILLATLVIGYLLLRRK